MNKKRFISLVVPAYKQEETIEEDLKNISKVLNSSGFEYEIILVVDGFLDKTFEKASKLKNKNLKIFGHKDNMGKGYAVKYGVLRSKGSIIGFIDSGGDIDPANILNFLEFFNDDKIDIVVGTKYHRESKVKVPIIRRILSWGYSNLCGLLFGFDVKDTQVGIKFFKGSVAEKVFRKVKVNRFAFDIEVLALAYKLGFRNIKEIPVRLNISKNSSVSSFNLITVIIKMFLDTILVFYRIKF